MTLHRKLTIGKMKEESEHDENMSIFRVKYNEMVKSKLLKYIFLSMYVFICLLGNVVTGLIFLKHRGNEDPQQLNERLNYTTEMLHLNTKTTKGGGNHTNNTFGKVDNSRNDAESAEEWNLYLLFGNDSNNEVSFLERVFWSSEM